MTAICNGAYFNAYGVLSPEQSQAARDALLRVRRVKA